MNDEDPSKIELNDEEEFTKPTFDDLKKLETWVHKLAAIRTTGRIELPTHLTEE